MYERGSAGMRGLRGEGVARGATSQPIPSPRREVCLDDGPLGGAFSCDKTEARPLPLRFC